MHCTWYCCFERLWGGGGKSGSKAFDISTHDHVSRSFECFLSQTTKFQSRVHSLCITAFGEEVDWDEKLSCESRFMLCDRSPRQIHELRALTALANAGEAVAIDRATQAPHTRPRKMALLDDEEGVTSSERAAQRKSQSVRCDCWDCYMTAWESTTAGLHVILFELTLHGAPDWEVHTVFKRVEKLSRRRVGGHFHSSILDLRIHINICILSMIISYDHPP